MKRPKLIGLLLALMLTGLGLSGCNDDSDSKVTSSAPVASKEVLLLEQAGDFNPAADTNDGIYIASLTDQYFTGGVEVGLEALLNAGKVYVNGIQVPATAAPFNMNGMPAIWQKSDGHWTWQAHDKLNADNEAKIPHNGDYSYQFARRRFVLAVSALRGMKTSIWANEGSTVASKVTFVIKSAAQAEEIYTEADGSITVYGVPIDATSYHTDGGPNDIEPRNIKPATNFDKNIEEGDTVLYWYDTTGWHMERAIPVQGVMTATDHFNITVNGVTHSDALIVRYNMQAGSRPMQFISATNTLGLSDVPVTLWNTDTGHVIGISRMKFARPGLEEAIDAADAQLAGKKLVVSTTGDGTDVPIGTYWVTQAVMDAYNTAYAAANDVLSDWYSTDAQLDAATQQLGVAFSGSHGPVDVLGMNSMQMGTKLLPPILLTLVNDGATSSVKAPFWTGTEITKPAYDKYFKEGNAVAGLEALLNAGKVYINGIKVPATADETNVYQVNGINALWKDEGSGTWGYSVHKYTVLSGYSFSDARRAFMEYLTTVRGHTTILYRDGDTDYCGKIYANNVESVQVEELYDHNINWYITRGDFALEGGRVPARFDVELLFFPTSNVDKTLQPGEFGVWWFGTTPDNLTGFREWHLERAVPLTGLLTKVTDPLAGGRTIYSTGGIERVESNVSRFNLMDSNRPTQFYTAHTRLGLEATIPVTTWCTSTGNPIGFTHKVPTVADPTGLVNAKAALSLAITNATAAKIQGGLAVLVSVNGADVPVARQWVTAAAMLQFNNAIAAAQTVYDNAPTTITCDWAIYQLSLALNSNGATAGTPTGFLNSLAPGTMP